MDALGSVEPLARLWAQAVRHAQRGQIRFLRVLSSASSPKLVGGRRGLRLGFFVGSTRSRTTSLFA
jgi:hypothetical protein